LKTLQKDSIWPFRRLPRRIPSRRSTTTAPQTTKLALPLRLQILDPETGSQGPMRFQTLDALRDYVKSSRRGVLSVVGPPDQGPLLLDKSKYATLDPSQVYSVVPSIPPAEMTIESHNQVFDRHWENRCRMRLSEYFEEEGLYVVEQPRLISGQQASWQGIWMGVDESVYLLECKSRISSVHMSCVSVLIIGCDLKAGGLVG
jgi:hypothetical protein